MPLRGGVVFLVRHYKKGGNVTKTAVAIGALSLALSIPFYAPRVLAESPSGPHWRSQVQTCAGLDVRGACEKWVNGIVETSNMNAPKTKGSLCGDAVKCVVENVGDTSRFVNQWTVICPLTGKFISAK